jgi:hypothetical protein
VAEEAISGQIKATGKTSKPDRVILSNDCPFMSLNKKAISVPLRVNFNPSEE